MGANNLLFFFFLSSPPTISLFYFTSDCRIKNKIKLGGGCWKSFLAEIMVVICGCGDHERAGVVAWLSSVCSDVFYDREMMFFQDG